MGRCRTGKSGIILHTCGSNWHGSIAYDTFKGGSAINENEKGIFSWIGTGVFTIIGIVYILPILIVLMNSFKKKVYINKEPFQIPSGKTFASIENYISAIDNMNF